MRVRLQGLAPALDAALRSRLLKGGHSIDTADPDSLVVGLELSPPTMPLVEVGGADWDAAIAATRAVFTAVRAQAAELADRGELGRIVIVVDPLARRTAPGQGMRAVAGAFLTTLAQVAALDLGQLGVAVNTLVAGWTEPAPEALADATPLARLAQPAEIAASCEFLLSPHSSYVTGATLVADGGFAITKAGGESPLR